MSTTTQVLKKSLRDEFSIINAQSQAITEQFNFNNTSNTAELEKMERIVQLALTYLHPNLGPYLILQFLKQNKIEALDLASKKITDEYVILLSEILRKNERIESLILGMNEIGDEGTIALAKALEENTSITELVLFGNKIGNLGAQALLSLFNNRKQPFTTCYLGENVFDEDHARLLCHALQTHHPMVVEEILNSLCQINPDQYQVRGIQGNDFMRKLVFTPERFLKFHETIGDTSVRMHNYSWISECHCIPLLSRSLTTDCRKILEDLLISHYTKLNLEAGSSFKLVSINSSDLFNELVILAKLIYSGKKGIHIQFDLIDGYKYPNHRIVVKNSPAMTLSLEFMALIHRMGVNVQIREKKNQKALLVESYGFSLFKSFFPKIQNAIATVTLDFYDSTNTYSETVKSGIITSPQVIVAIDSVYREQEVLELKKHVENHTFFFSLEKGCKNGSQTKGVTFDNVRIEVIQKGSNGWTAKINPMNFEFNYDQDEKIRKEKFDLNKAISMNMSDPFMVDGKESKELKELLNQKMLSVTSQFLEAESASAQKNETVTQQQTSNNIVQFSSQTVTQDSQKDENQLKTKSTLSQGS